MTMNNGNRNKQIRILHILQQFLTGGIERTVTDLIRSRDDQFETYALSVLPKTCLPFEEILEKENLRIYYLKRTYTPEETNEKRRDMEEVIREIQPDIIHTHHLVIRDVLELPVLDQVPIRLHTVHVDALLEANFMGESMVKEQADGYDQPESDIAHNIDHFVRLAGDPGAYALGYKNISFRSSPIYKNFDIDGFIDKALSGARVFQKAFRQKAFVPISVSRSVQLSLSQIYGIKQQKLIYNGIFLEDFFQVECDRADSGLFRIIHVGRFELGKNQDLLIDAFYAAHEVNPCLRLTFVGDGIYRPSLQKKAVRLGLGDRITFTGTRMNVAEYLSQHDLFVLPSMAESFGVVLAEAMAAGLPVVATDVGGVSELVANGESGILVAPNNVDQLKHALLWMADNPEKRQAMAQRGKELAKQFDIHRTSREYAAFYKLML